MKPLFTMRQALDDRQLLAATLSGPSWQAWRVLLIAAMGERLAAAERRIFTKLTGRAREPGHRIEEFWAVVGRRGGKSRAMAVLATYIAGLCDHRDVLVPGEKGILLCVAPDQRQAGILVDYAEAGVPRYADHGAIDREQDRRRNRADYRHHDRSALGEFS